MSAQKLIEEKEWNYYVYEDGNTILLSVPIPRPTPGFDVLHTLTEYEKEHYLSNGIQSLENRIKDMNTNYSNYKMISWR